MKTKKGKFTIQTTIVLMVLILLVVGYYCYLVNRSNRSAQEKVPTTVESVLLRDLEHYYPHSQRGDPILQRHNQVFLQ